MNSFGLGLVLNFVDNATSGMGNATRAFQQMSITADAVSSSVSTSIADIVTASYALDAVGSTLMGTGSSIISLYTDVSQKVIDTGMELMGYRNQLKALYGDDAFEQKMQDIQQYAADSVFEVQGLTQAVITMKAVGIEAMNEISTSSGEHTQTLLDYASDIAAMFPNMRNAYGTGVNAAMGALKEYIAEGNALSLKRGAGLDITGLLGEDKGSTIEARTRQVADLVEQLGIAGYTEKLMGTPTQQLSRMQDILFNTMAKISDSGVLDRYTSLLSKVADWMDKLTKDTETYDTIVSIMGDTLDTLLSPLESILDFLLENSNAIIKWVKENPKLTKSILLTVAALGAFLVAGGAFLKLVSSIGMASAGLSFLTKFPTLLSSLGSAFGGLIAKALPFVSLAAVAYFAWSNNLFGIRDVTTRVLGDLGAIFSLIGSAWSDNTLTYDEFQKAQQLGILPLIESILQLKYYWDFLVQGFKDGFKSFFDGLVETLNQLGVLDVDINTLIASIGEFLRSLIDVGAEDKWTSIGKSLGEIAGALVTITVILSSLKAILPVLKVIGTVLNLVLIKPLSLVGKLFKPFFTNIKNIVTVLKGGQGVGFFTKLLEVIVAVVRGGMGLKDAMTVVFGGVATTVSGIISFVGGLATAAYAFVKQLVDGFSWFWEIIKWIGLAIAAVGAVLLGIVSGPIAAIVAAVVGAVTTIIVLVKQYWNEICAFFSTVGSWIYDNVIVPVATFFVNLWNGIVDGVLFVVNGIVNFFSSIASWIYDNVIAPVVNFFVVYIYPFIEKIVEIVAKIIEIIVVLTRVFVQWVYSNVIKPVATFFADLWNWIVTGVQNFVDGFMNAIIVICEWVNTNIVQPIATFFANLWNGLITGVQNFIDGFVAFFYSAVESIKEFFSPLATFFQEMWDGIVSVFSAIGTAVADAISGAVRGAINGILNGAAGIINGFIRAINAAIGLINEIPGVEISKLTLLQVPQLAEGGVVDKPTLAEIGEDGKEAVVPLEKNTEGLDLIAKKIAPRLSGQSHIQGNLTPVKEEHNDYSVTFMAGSVVIQLANATEAELEKAAEKLMRIIERKQQLKKMAVRA